MNPDRPPPKEDPEIDPHELENADQIQGSDAPEVDEQTAELTSWDESPETAGSAAHKVLPEDEVPPGEQLVEEGVEQADRDQRIAAADPDFEP